MFSTKKHSSRCFFAEVIVNERNYLKWRLFLKPLVQLASSRERKKITNRQTYIDVRAAGMRKITFLCVFNIKQSQFDLISDLTFRISHCQFLTKHGSMKFMTFVHFTFARFSFTVFHSLVLIHS
jgi:hypothetical protein